MKNIWFLLLLSILTMSCKKNGAPLETVPNVDINKYLGTWYEIARFPHSFEKNLVAVTATYSMDEDGKIKVLNKGYKGGLDGKLKTAEGTARIPDLSKPGRLEVTFFWPFAGEYLILELEKENYEYALIGSTSRNYLWILSRAPKLDPVIYNRLVVKADELGFDTTKIELVPQRPSDN